MEPTRDRDAIAATYLELEPSEPLRRAVRAFFAFVPGWSSGPPDRRPMRHEHFGPGDPYSGPMLATAGTSLVLEPASVCRAGRWFPARLFQPLLAQ